MLGRHHIRRDSRPTRNQPVVEIPTGLPRARLALSRPHVNKQKEALTQSEASLSTDLHMAFKVDLEWLDDH